jgi:hypothetical protein
MIWGKVGRDACRSRKFADLARLSGKIRAMMTVMQPGGRAR